MLSVAFTLLCTPREETAGEGVAGRGQQAPARSSTPHPTGQVLTCQDFPFLLPKSRGHVHLNTVVSPQC